MPVDDHPIHPSTQIDAGKRYGCWNHRPFASGYYAPNRVHGFEGRFSVELKWIAHAMSRECRYDQLEDPRCIGCRYLTDKLRSVQNAKND